MDWIERYWLSLLAGSIFVLGITFVGHELGAMLAEERQRCERAQAVMFAACRRDGGSEYQCRKDVAEMSCYSRALSMDIKQ